MKVITLDSFDETLDFRNNISVIESSLEKDQIVIVFKNNSGGSIYLGNVLLNALNKCSSKVLLVVEEMIASTASFVWLYFYLIQKKNITIELSKPFFIMFHRAREYTSDGAVIFCDQNSTPELKRGAEQFDKLIPLLKKHPSIIPYKISDTGICDIQWNDAEKSYARNEDIFLRLSNWDKYVKNTGLN